jgi:adenine-specific DNA-methyltransferase
VGTAEIEHLFGEQVFSFPKPFSLIRSLVQVTTQEGDLVLDFFAGSGTTGHAVLSLNEEDEGERSFILVSNTEATADEPDKNLCRDVCAVRLRKAIAGHGDTEPLSGDFAYLRTKRLDWDDAPYDLTNEQIWTLIQLRHQRPLLPFDPSAPVQANPPAPDEAEGGYLVLVPEWTPAAEAELRRLLTLVPVQAFSPAPGAIRASINLPHLSIEAAPGRLMDEFPRVIAGL